MDHKAKQFQTATYIPSKLSVIESELSRAGAIDDLELEDKELSSLLLPSESEDKECFSPKDIQNKKS